MSVINDEQKIQIVITGGTIDSFYDTEQCTTVCHKKTAIPEFLMKFAKISKDEFELFPVCMKDSRDIGTKEIQEVSNAIINSNCAHHIVTHGTFTLFESARKLMALLPDDHGRVIVFTGAMWPLVGFSPNDAGFNLGSAFIAARLAEPGVYVAFNGKLYLPNDLEGLH
ncbi:asparaginase domain-containing protein [Photobacterium lipolyticum]|uniref:Asparaginase n=1 Tax=Photobacterium lipolyticum TaxID=266810 RepID=A0A2T3MZ99_9GAMM|nr:asparaginase domain-containing protein [Photobacterium lipolyticum]PSW05230.1 asparaginase [Photobacterium lipolyticum]